MVTSKVLLFGLVSLNNNPKELNIDVEITFKNQFLNFKFQKAPSYFPETFVTLFMVTHFVFEERRMLPITEDILPLCLLSTLRVGLGREDNCFDPGVS